MVYLDIYIYKYVPLKIKAIACVEISRVSFQMHLNYLDGILLCSYLQFARRNNGKVLKNFFLFLDGFSKLISRQIRKSVSGVEAVQCPISLSRLY